MANKKSKKLTNRVMSLWRLVSFPAQSPKIKQSRVRIDNSNKFLNHFKHRDSKKSFKHEKLSFCWIVNRVISWSNSMTLSSGEGQRPVGSPLFHNNRKQIYSRLKRSFCHLKTETKANQMGVHDGEKHKNNNNHWRGSVNFARKSHFVEAEKVLSLFFFISNWLSMRRKILQQSTERGAQATIPTFWHNVAC